MQSIYDEVLALLPTGEQVHDALMGTIEPDLVSANLLMLKEKYKDETPEERKERIVRYKTAIQKYDKAVSKYFDNVDGVIDKQRDQVQEQSRKQDEGKMQNIEDQFSLGS